MELEVRSGGGGGFAAIIYRVDDIGLMPACVFQALKTRFESRDEWLGIRDEKRAVIEVAQLAR